MHPVRRRGFTLAELIVALVLSVIVGFAIVRMMNSSQRLTRVQYARIDSQQSALSAVYYFNALLRELDASEGDVQTATPTLLQVRAMRWTAISCSAVTTSGSDLQITIKNSQTFGARGPSVPLDSLLVFDEKTPATRSDDVWLVAWLTGTAAGNCADGTPGLVLSLRITAAGGGNAECSANCTLGSPIRGFQVEELSLYNDGAGAYWLGRRSKDLSGAWSAMEQVAGPLAAGGLTMTYLDTLNAATIVPANIASVGVVVRTRSTDATGANPGNVQDSLITRVALRNNKRF